MILQFKGKNNPRWIKENESYTKDDILFILKKYPDGLKFIKQGIDPEAEEILSGEYDNREEFINEVVRMFRLEDTNEDNDINFDSTVDTIPPGIYENKKQTNRLLKPSLNEDKESTISKLKDARTIAASLATGNISNKGVKKAGRDIESILTEIIKDLN
jgi:hypothetical protein